MEIGFVKADSDNLPQVDMEMVNDFYISNLEYLSAEMRNIKTKKSTKESYGDNAISYVQLQRNDNICTVKCKITPEHKIHKKAYNVICVINENEEKVLDCHCNDCAAAQGGCKHAVAFLFWLHRRSEEPSVTSKECYWKASKLSKMGTAVKYMALKDMHEGYKDITPKDESILEDLLEQLGKQKGGIFDFYNTNELSKFDLYDLILSYKEQKNQYDADEFIQFASKMMECNLAEVEKRTRDQSSSKEWFQMRFGRITASKIYEAAKCKTSAGSLMESIMGGVRPLETEPVKRGKQLEPAVIKRVEKMKGISIRKCGLLLNNNYPMLGASPDGLSNNYCIEVKCPSKEKNIENYVKDGIVNKRYYYQLQIQLFFANKTKGLFCVASPSFETNREVQITEVEFNEDESTEIMNAAMDYWKNCVFPVLCDM